ncbi:MAG TPA: D-2-hydroxyacid dehydrogenase [Capsulimonadaceae bacterium]|jgi:glycerate dehydrogenase
MKIVVLDTAPFDHGDIDWEPLRQLGDVELYASTPANLVDQRLDGVDIAITNKVPIREININVARPLKMISVLATGYNVIDVDAAARRGIAVSNVPGYSAAFTAQTAIALLMELANRTGVHAESVRSGEWAASPTFSYWKTPLVELAGRTMLIVGYGTIGRRVATIANALGLHVVLAQFPGRESEDSIFARVPVDEGFAIADVVSLHAPLTDQTRELVNARRLDLIDPGALIVNTSRGDLINENDVAEALKTGHLAGYAADVLSTEPPAADNPLLTAPNTIITPHIGWASVEARRRLMDETTQNIAAFLAGHPRNLVN